ncbi:carotenoid oxygenase family protein [Nocardia callitridis]|uniref:Dioxygenase n=1 Tax=Nocardia callitridis TaxID=648753 RepID=A0ABP9KVG8_9NOCA
MTTVPYLSGHYTPVPDQITAVDLPVEGLLPPELHGTYIRNGHNPKPGITPSHWFTGSGMLHGVRLTDGKAEWYRNRWVHTPAFERDSPLIRADGSVDLTASVAGTHIIEHGGRLLALQEANLPFEVGRDLETLGPYDFHGKLDKAMTAHPKVDPDTGELHFFSYSPRAPHVTYLIASEDGVITHSRVIEGAGPSLMHDFAITATKSVFLDLSVVFDRTEQSGIPYRWHDDYPSRFGVLDRATGEIVWIPVDPTAVLHVTNAYDRSDGTVVLEGPRYDRAAWETSWKWWVGTPGFPIAPVTGAVATRWILDPKSATVSESILDDLSTDFPTINDEFTGRPSAFSYSVAFPGSGLNGFALVKNNSTTGNRILYEAGPDRHAGEAVFVPAAGATAEDDGYLLSIVSDLRANAAQLLVLNAVDLSPVATVHLPRRVPSGIHGSWIPDAHR